MNILDSDLFTYMQEYNMIVGELSTVEGNGGFLIANGVKTLVIKSQWTGDIQRFYFHERRPAKGELKELVFLPKKADLKATGLKVVLFND